MSFYGKILLQEKHWHLVLLHHSWRHLVVLNWLLAPDKNTKTLQYAWVPTENSKCQFHIKIYHFGSSSFMWSVAVSIQVAEPMHWYFTAAEQQFVSLTNHYHQHRLYHLLLLCHPLVLHHHHFITASLLSQPHLIAPSQPCLCTHHSNPLYHQHHHYPCTRHPNPLYHQHHHYLCTHHPNPLYHQHHHYLCSTTTIMFTHHRTALPLLLQSIF